jgi:hypothetical protein
MVVRMRCRVQELRLIDEEKDICRRIESDEVLYEVLLRFRGPKKGLTAEA